MVFVALFVLIYVSACYHHGLNASKSIRIFENNQLDNSCSSGSRVRLGIQVGGEEVIQKHA
jgi:hypothetical protein